MNRRLSLRWRVAAAFGVGLALVMAVLAVATWDLFWPPAISLLSHGADEVRVEQTFAFAIQSMAWGPGAFLGSAGGGVLAEAAGDAAAWTTMAVVCVLSLPLVRRRG